MATKTLILRPTSITCDDESLVTFYPSDTTLVNAHLLVDEETSDDDATYITGGLGSNISYGFSFTKPDDLKNITDFSFTVRHKLESSSQQHEVTYQIQLGADNYTLNTLSKSDNPIEYTDMSDKITDDIKNAIVTALSSSQNVSFNIAQIVSTGHSSKSKPIRTT